MPRTDRPPYYMPYTQNPHAYEYNIFPELYFCGTDVAIYFNKVLVSQTAAFSVAVQEQHRPVYGYASRTFDQMAIGNRIVVGQIKIPFTDAKYMRNILEKVQKELDDANVTGSTDALPDNRKFPSWMANSLDTKGNAIAPNEFPKVGHIAGVATTKIYSGPGTSYSVVGTLSKGDNFDIIGVNTDSSSSCWFNISRYGQDANGKEIGIKGCVYRDFVLCRSGVGAMPDGISLIVRYDQNESVAKVQAKLNQDADVVKGMGGKISVDGSYGDNTYLAVNLFKAKRSLIQDDTGVVGAKTWDYLNAI